MARRNNRQNILQGPGFTDVFKSKSVDNGPDGQGAREFLLSCAADSPVPLEYRVEVPGDPAGEVARLAPGETAPLRSDGPNVINHIVMRGVGGAAIGGVEVTKF